jgi:pyruvate formate lyase activating enzyme
VTAPGRFWHPVGDDRIQCDLCPRDCRLADAQRGLCFVRQNQGGAMVLTTWGRSSGFCLDPIEKKPLNHFLPGSSVLSFGTAGCNLTCRFCQNWDISKSREMDRLQAAATPEAIAAAAVRSGARSVAYTYNDPVIFAEYALDVAAACRAVGVRSVAVTAGYIHAEARREFFAGMDAANIDLKGFTPAFYRDVCGGDLEVVLETLELPRALDAGLDGDHHPAHPRPQRHPRRGRGPERLGLEHLGPEVPLHFTAFHPDYRMPIASRRRRRRCGGPARRPSPSA